MHKNEEKSLGGLTPGIRVTEMRESGTILKFLTRDNAMSVFSIEILVQIM
jgi:hypothetical protein